MSMGHMRFAPGMGHELRIRADIGEIGAMVNGEHPNYEKVIAFTAAAAEMVEVEEFALADMLLGRARAAAEMYQ